MKGLSSLGSRVVNFPAGKLLKKNWVKPFNITILYFKKKSLTAEAKEIF